MSPFLLTLLWLVTTVVAGSEHLILSLSLFGMGALTWLIWREGSVLRSLLKLPTRRGCLVTVVASALLLALTYSFSWLLGGVGWFSEPVLELYKVFFQARGPWAMVGVAWVVVVEEIIWRGAIQERIGRLTSSGGGVAISALLYACAQVGNGSWVLVLAALFLGLYWGALRRWSGSVWAPIFVHLIWDGFVLFWVPLKPFFGVG